MSHTSTTLKDAAVHRRTIYQLNKKAPVDDKQIEEVFRLAIKEVPSSFNSQSARIVVLLKDDHDAFWDIVRDILKAHVPEDKWEHTGQRIEGFRKAYGTALFYEDPAPIKTLQTNLPAYADKFPQWSEHTSAMHQYFLWTALEAEGFGCNLQHYNPLPDQKAAAKWNIPLEWSLKAQLVFGGEEEGARAGLQERSEQPIGDRLFIHGAAK
ncbi:putative nitroreductase [Friedmanniomyces endolithicus]|nr:putative nitroreductase [Friedmanniomyces endolithicus]KAK0941923.1 putative nitroreductase [Friedmanniomyces endolithicus]